MSDDQQQQLDREEAEKWMHERAKCERVQSRMEFNSFDVVDAYLAGLRAERRRAAEAIHGLRFAAKEQPRDGILNALALLASAMEDSALDAVLEGGKS